MTKSDLSLYGLVHDLNNVFQTILEAADLVSADPEWASTAALIFRAVEQGKRISTSIVETDREDVDLEKIVRQALQFAQDFMQSIRGPAVEAEMAIPPGLRPMSSPGPMERVFMNLFINAARAAGEAAMSVSQIRVSANRDGDCITICVADNGPGIDEQILPVIFAPRFSTSASRSGLGLHIVESIIRENGGAVAARNGESGGAEFILTVPAAGIAGKSQPKCNGT